MLKVYNEKTEFRCGAIDWLGMLDSMKRQTDAFLILVKQGLHYSIPWISSSKTVLTKNCDHYLNLVDLGLLRVVLG